ncbi:MAG: arsenate reductase ArsC [Phycisphaerales bacterium]
MLFLCTGNSCRSQMAEGWARVLLASRVRAYSAGTRPQGLNRLAVRVMEEAGVDIGAHTSKNVDELQPPFDLVVTVCDNAREVCPVLPGMHTIHVAFDDPPALARLATSDDEALPHYRRVRDEIRRFVQSLSDVFPERPSGEMP